MKLLTKAEVAELLGCSGKTVDRLASSGCFSRLKIGGRSKFYYDEVLAYMEQRTIRI